MQADLQNIKSKILPIVDNIVDRRKAFEKDAASFSKQADKLSHEETRAMADVRAIENAIKGKSYGESSDDLKAKLIVAREQLTEAGLRRKGAVRGRLTAEAGIKALEGELRHAIRHEIEKASHEVVGHFFGVYLETISNFVDGAEKLRTDAIERSGLKLKKAYSDPLDQLRGKLAAAAHSFRRPV